VAACAGIADYFDALYRHHEPQGDLEREGPSTLRRLIRVAEQELLAPLLDYLSHLATRSDIRVLGPCDPLRRAPTVSLVPGGRDPAEIATELGKRGIISCAGHFYAPRVLDAMGVDSAIGVLRLSMVHYNTPGEVNDVIAALDEILP
jgi:selenocysteine lyase/cysteine desulfurase